MAVIKAKKVEFQVLKQDVNGAASKYYDDFILRTRRFQSKEIVNIVLCDETPYISILEEKYRQQYKKLLQRTTRKTQKHPEQLFT